MRSAACSRSAVQRGTKLQQPRAPVWLPTVHTCVLHMQWQARAHSGNWLLCHADRPHPQGLGHDVHTCRPTGARFGFGTATIHEGIGSPSRVFTPECAAHAGAAASAAAAAAATCTTADAAGAADNDSACSAALLLLAEVAASVLNQHTCCATSCTYERRRLICKHVSGCRQLVVHHRRWRRRQRRRQRQANACRCSQGALSIKLAHLRSSEVR